jgi:hypothetical protein
VAKASGPSMTQLAYDQLRNEILTGALTCRDKDQHRRDRRAHRPEALGAVREALSRLSV